MFSCVNIINAGVYGIQISILEFFGPESQNSKPTIWQGLWHWDSGPKMLNISQHNSNMLSLSFSVWVRCCVFCVLCCVLCEIFFIIWLSSLCVKFWFSDHWGARGTDLVQQELLVWAVWEDKSIMEMSSEAHTCVKERHSRDRKRNSCATIFYQNLTSLQ